MIITKGIGCKLLFFAAKNYCTTKAIPNSENVISSILQYFPYSILTYSCTLTLYTWAVLIQRMEGNSFILKIQKGVHIYFMILIPLSIILPAIGTFYYGIVFLLIMIVLFIFISLLVCVSFAYSGFKFLLFMKEVSKEIHEAKPTKIVRATQKK